jgi:hypothetical protein
MTAQHHINAIGDAVTELEEASEDVKRASKRVVRATRKLHKLLEEAQAAYCEAHSSDNVVAFSGGTNKPPVDDSDEPVDPVP